MRGPAYARRIRLRVCRGESSQLASQFSTASPGTRENAPALPVTTIRPSAAGA